MHNRKDECVRMQIYNIQIKEITVVSICKHSFTTLNNSVLKNLTKVFNYPHSPSTIFSCGLYGGRQVAICSCFAPKMTGLILHD